MICGVWSPVLVAEDDLVDAAEDDGFVRLVSVTEKTAEAPKEPEALEASGSSKLQSNAGHESKLGNCYGWRCSSSEEAALGLANANGGDLYYCDIPVIDAQASLGDVEADITSYRKTPFIVRGMETLKDMQLALSKDNMVELGRRKGLFASYGFSWDIVMNKGEGTRTAPLDEFITSIIHRDTYDGEEPLERPYSFDRESKVMQQLGISLEIPKLVESLNASAFTPASAKPIFMIGSARSGIGFHRHGTALHYNVHGRKRWFFYKPKSNPPGGVHGSWGIVDWLQRVYPVTKRKSPPVECIQQPGDVLYIPEGWYHAVVNLADSVAVTLQRSAHLTEFLSLEVDAKNAEDESARIKLLKRLMKLQPKNLEARLQLFRARKRSDPQKALLFIAEAIAKDPFLIDAQYDMVNFLVDLHKEGVSSALLAMADALAGWIPYLEKNTRSFQANHMLAQHYMLKGEKAKGIDHLRRVVQLQDLGVQDRRVELDFKQLLESALSR